ncbi:16S rRNA pseudouridine(516) synthase RsuA [Cellvibrio fibrivorans]|uniref:Pseudouridine synthase n=1 Tax=Cellvibrio fibrivorans TaxID=126350 RepID=A0ABU1UVY7_9GAMM|nr:16S rRNA pseudouridine(516) synthase RsuA [Cellvibrio fibrivorans]MDR7089315.1 16S rRNA pseudouridine516 synthase [Cellvibrio fibrivorans]
MRLDKFLSQNSDSSRSLIQQAIKAGRVSVNDVIAKKGDQKLLGDEIITFDGKQVEAFQTRYLMLHKPLGYVCANSDSDYPVVMDLIRLPRWQELQIVGRLDIDTTGLVLLTDDGQWNHRITSPRHECDKIYRVTTANPISTDTAELFAAGVQLHGEKAPTRPAQLELISSHEARLKIHEGKYHQVKRMFAAAGNLVVALHRESIGNIQLDPALAPGEYRALTAEEIKSVAP